VRLWALASAEARATLALYRDEEAGRAALRDALADDPWLAGLADVITLDCDSGVAFEPPCLN
jgi:hypothetical protein